MIIESRAMVCLSGAPSGAPFWDRPLASTTNIKQCYKTFYGSYLVVLYFNKLKCLPLPFTSTLVQYLWARLELTKAETLTGLHTNCKFLDLPTNIRLRRERIVLANTLVHYNMATITVVKSFIVQAPSLTFINRPGVCPRR